MDIVMIAGVVVVAAFLAVMLRQQRPEQAMARQSGGRYRHPGPGAVQGLTRHRTLRELLSTAALPEEYGAILFKALGICLLTQLAADACKDAGESALASKAELAGKLMLLMLALPLFEKIAQLAASLINGEAIS